MKRIFSYVVLAFLAVFFTVAHAQQNIYIWRDGNVSVRSVAAYDSITTSVNKKLFTIHVSAATSVTNNTFEVAYSWSSTCSFRVISLKKYLLEEGICLSSTNANPTYADGHICINSDEISDGLVGDYDQDGTFTFLELDPGTTYYYRYYVKYLDDIFYSNVESVTTLGEKSTSPTYTLMNGHKFVDLGLPSGLLWATTNVGASSCSEAGDYFAWGETEPKSDYSWDTYKWGSDENNLSKYKSSDGKTMLDPEDDAATANWGAPCRMPSFADYEELYSKCEWLWVDNKRESGYLIIGTNGNTIFLPVTGYHYGTSCNNVYFGYYWISSLYSDDVCWLVFSSADKTVGLKNRFVGLTVRPVAEK